MTDKDKMNEQEQIAELVKDYKCCIACEMYNKYASHPCIDYKLPVKILHVDISEDLKKDFFTNEIEYETMKAYEVIGNIYDNPELIGE